MLNQTVHKDYCLICVSRCPRAGLQYSWKATKQFYDGTMEHFDLFGEGREHNPRRRYETKSYFAYVNFHVRVSGKRNLNM